MFRLIKLAIYAAAGYLLYEFIRGMTDESQGGGGGGHQEARGGQQESQGGGQANYRQRAETGGSVGGQAMMGGPNPTGMAVATQDADGGSVTERVGRGVIPQM